MLSNIATWLRPGGTFIGTIPDEETLFARLHDLPDTSQISFGNENYRIEFDERHDAGEKPFGNKYRFWLDDAVDDVPEYVVDWPTFEKYVRWTDAQARSRVQTKAGIQGAL